MAFPKKLIDYRKKRGYTQQTLADKVGIHVTQIKRYEAGTAQPTLEAFRNIAIALNVSADTMLFDRTDKEVQDDLSVHLRLKPPPFRRADLSF